MTAYRKADVNGVEIFYREAGDPRAATLLLLHGFPTSSTQYGDLIDRLSDRFHLVAPDYPGFGYTQPLEGTTTFDRIADVLDGFVDAVGLDHYGLYVFDFGAPIGFRLATRHPERPTGRTGMLPNRRPAVSCSSPRPALSTSRALGIRRASILICGRSTSIFWTCRNAIG
jgi:pimeloyl-ACP methyl ester carboxylesterase